MLQDKKKVVCRAMSGQLARGSEARQTLLMRLKMLPKKNLALTSIKMPNLKPIVCAVVLFQSDEGEDATSSRPARAK